MLALTVIKEISKRVSKKTQYRKFDLKTKLFLLYIGKKNKQGCNEKCILRIHMACLTNISKMKKKSGMTPLDFPNTHYQVFE